MMGGKVEGAVVGAKPGHHSHLSHWTKSWNLESQPHSCWTQTRPDLGECSPHQADTVALGPSLAGTQSVDNGGSGGDVGLHMMHAQGEICVYAFHNGPFGLKLRSLAWVLEWVAGQPHLD